MDLGGKRLRRIDTPHVPHGWDAGIYFEETTATLLSGDLFTAFGNRQPITERDIVGPALVAEDAFHQTCLTPATGMTIRGLAQLQPRTLSLMPDPPTSGTARSPARPRRRLRPASAFRGGRLLGPGRDSQSA